MGVEAAGSLSVLCLPVLGRGRRAFLEAVAVRACRWFQVGGFGQVLQPEERGRGTRSCSASAGSRDPRLGCVCGLDPAVGGSSRYRGEIGGQRADNPASSCFACEAVL